jgi:hypothetical protein
LKHLEHFHRHDLKVKSDSLSSWRNIPTTANLYTSLISHPHPQPIPTKFTLAKLYQDAFEIFHLLQERPDQNPSHSSSSNSHILSALGHALSGSLGSAVSNAALYPIDLIITRLQIQRQIRKHRPQNNDDEYKGFLDGLRKIYDNEGGVPGLYTGILQDTGKTIADAFLFFLIYSFLRDRRVARHTRSNGGRKVGLPALEELGVGFVAGSLTKLCTTPIANVVTRKQAAAMMDSSQRSPTTRQIANDILRYKGWQGFWSGYSASLVLTLNPSITFFLFEFLKKMVLPRSRRDNPPARLTFLLSALSKATASSITYPFSLAKARLQAGGVSSKSEDEDEKSTIDKDFQSPESKQAARATIFSTLLTIAQTEGVEVLYEGLHVEVFKAFFSHGLTMLVKQFLQRLLSQISYTLSIILSRYQRRRGVGAKRMKEKARASVEYYNLAMARAGEKIEELAEGVRSKANETAEFVGEYVEEGTENWQELYGTVGIARWLDKGRD